MVGFAYSAHPVSYYPLRAKSGFDHFTGEVLEISACVRPARRTTGAFFDGYRTKLPLRLRQRQALCRRKGYSRIQTAMIAADLLHQIKHHYGFLNYTLMSRRRCRI